MNINDIQRLLGPLARRIENLVSRAVVRKTDDAKKVQELQLDVLEGETRDEVERFGEYGFTSVPVDGAEAVVIFVGGRREHGLVLGVEDRRYRPTGLEPGEVAMYSKHGQTIVLKTNGDIELTPKSGQKLKVVGPTELAGDVTVTGDLDASGTVTGSTDVVGGGKSLASHVHTMTPANSPIAVAGAVGTISGTSGAPS